MTDRQPTPTEAIIAEAAYQYATRDPDKAFFHEREYNDLEDLRSILLDGYVDFLGMAAAIVEALEKAKGEA